MERIKSVAKTLYNHKKKAIVFAAVVAYGVDYGRLWVRDCDIRTYYAKQAMKFGEHTISAEQRPRRITVLVNRNADTGSGFSNFQQNALPLLNLAGIAVNVIKAKDAEELKNLCSVMDKDEADGLIVVGGDGTLNDAIAGLVQRAANLDPMPMGVFPGGRNNKGLQLLVASVFRERGDVRHMCESAMAVIEESVRPVKPIKCDLSCVVRKEDETEEVKREVRYTISDISDGWFSYIEDKKWKFWYWAGLKRRFAYGWEMLKNSPEQIRTEISITDYCSGCNKCRTTIVPPKPVWRWYHYLIGPPKAPVSDPSFKNYSQIENEGCGRQTEMCAQGTDYVVLGEQHEDSCSLRLRVGGTFASRWAIARDGWYRCKLNFIVRSGQPGFYTTDLIASAITMKFLECPQSLRKLFVGGETVDFEVPTTVTIQAEEKSIPLFIPKHTRVSLEALS